MSEQIASGHILVSLDDQASRQLDQIERKFDRTMADISNERAVAEIDARLAPLEDKVKQARRQLKALEGERAEARLDADKKDLDRKILEARRQIKALDGQKATVEIETKGEAEAIKAQERIRRATIREMEAIERKEQERAKVWEATERKKARVAAALSRQREQILAREMTEAERMDRLRDREIAQIPRVRREYAELAIKMQDLQKARRRAFGNDNAVMTVDFKIAEAQAKLEAFRKFAERHRIELKPDINLTPGADFGRHVRAMFDSHGVSGAAYAFGATAGDSVLNGIKRRFSPRAVGGVIKRGFGRVGDVLEGLSDLKISVGPFVGSLRTVAIAASILAPIIADVVGAAGSLVSVAGSAALGVGALGVAVAGGAIPAMIGFATVMVPVVKQTGRLLDIAQKHNGVLEEGSRAQQKFNKILAGTSKETREAFLNAGTLNDRWKEATQPSRVAGFNMIGQGLRYVSDNMGMFGDLTNGTFARLESGTNRFFRRLNSQAARNALGEMWGNFNKTIGPTIAGLSNVGAYLGRVGQVASRFLPGMSRGFSDWSQRLFDTTKADDFDNKVNRVVQSARRVGALFMSAGRFVKSFFAAGVDGGERFVDAMRNTLDGWTRFNESAGGRAKLREFFENSVQGAKRLYNALAPLAQTFAEWAINLAPAVGVLLDVAGAINDVVTGLVRMVGLNGPLGTLAATLGTMFVIGRIRGAAGALMNFGKALLGVKMAQAGGGVLASVLGGAAGAKGAGGLKTAAKDAGLLATALGSLGSGAAVQALPKLAMGALRVAGPIGAVLTGAVVLNKAFENLAGEGMGSTRQGILEINNATGQTSLSLKGLAIGAKDVGVGLFNAMDYAADGFSDAKDEANNFSDWMDKAGQVSDDAHVNFLRARDATEQVGRAQAQTNITLKQARQALDSTRKGSLDYQQALLTYRSALVDNMTAERDWNTVKRASRQTAADQLKAAQLQYARLNDLYGAGKLNAAQQAQLAAAAQQVTARMNTQAAVNANLARSYRGMAKATGQAEQQLGSLARAGNRRLATRIAVSYESPKDAGRVAAAASAALRAGVRSTIITRIVADSRNAEEAIRRIGAMKLSPKTLRIIQRGGPQAMAILNDLVGKKLAPKVMRILGSSKDAESKVQALVALGIPPKIARMLGDNRDALAKAAQANATKLNSLAQQIIRSIVNPGGLFSALPAITQTVVRVLRNAFASGGPADPASKSAAGFTKSEEMRMPVVGRAATAHGRRVNRPTLMVGEENRSEIVISTNPAYRRSNIAYLKAAAQQLGVDMAAKGKGPKGALDLYRTRATQSPGGITPDRLPAVRNFWAQKDVEDDWNNQIRVAEGRLKPPSSFIKATGAKDEDGNPLYEVDKARVAGYESRLNNVASLYDNLIAATNRLITMGDTAREALAGYQARRQASIADQNNKRQQAEAALKRVPRDAKGARTEAGKKREAETNKRRAADREKYKKLIDRYNEGIRTQRGLYNDASTEDQAVSREQYEARYRVQEYKGTLADYREEAGALGALARDEAAGANPTAKPPGSSDPGGGSGDGGGGTGGGSGDGGGTSENPVDTSTAAEKKIASLNAEQAMSDAGLGGRERNAILNDLKAAFAERLAEGQAMLSDRNPDGSLNTANDVEAYGIIQQSAEAIKNINDTLNAASNQVAAQFMALGTARQDLYSNFANNFKTAAGFGQMGQAIGAGVAAGLNGGIGARTATGLTAGAGAGPAGQQGVVFNQTFNQMPDPHTWSQGVAFELQAAL